MFLREPQLPKNNRKNNLSFSGLQRTCQTDGNPQDFQNLCAQRNTLCLYSYWDAEIGRECSKMRRGDAHGKVWHLLRLFLRLSVVIKSLTLSVYRF